MAQYPSVIAPNAQLKNLTCIWGQLVPHDHFNFSSYISQTVCLWSKGIVPWDVPHPKLRIHILVEGITTIPWLLKHLKWKLAQLTPVSPNETIQLNEVTDKSSFWCIK